MSELYKFKFQKKANELNAKSKELQRKIKSETGKDPDYRYLILT